MSLYFVRDATQYYADVLVQSDDDSRAGQRFRYVSRYRGELWWPDPHPGRGQYHLLWIAACVGDLSFLQYLVEWHGGAAYDQWVVHEALPRGHLAFLIQYLELVSGWVVEGEAGRWLQRYRLMSDIAWFSDDCPDAVTILLRYLFDHLFPTLPSPADLGRYVRHLHPQFRAWNHDEAIDCILLAEVSISWRHSGTLRFLVEDRGHRLPEHVLANVSVWGLPGLYAYVLAHLEPGLDRDSLQARYPMQPISLQSLLTKLSRAFRMVVQHRRSQGDGHRLVDWEKAYIAELLAGNADLIPKAVCLTRFLKSGQCLGNERIRKVLCKPMESDRRHLDEQQHIVEMADFLLEVLQDMQVPLFADIDWSVECQVDWNNVILR